MYVYSLYNTCIWTNYTVCSIIYISYYAISSCYTVFGIYVDHGNPYDDGPLMSVVNTLTLTTDQDHIPMQTLGNISKLPIFLDVYQFFIACRKCKSKQKHSIWTRCPDTMPNGWGSSTCIITKNGCILWKGSSCLFCHTGFLTKVSSIKWYKIWVRKIALWFWTTI